MNISCVHAGERKVVCNGLTFSEAEASLTPESTMFWVYLGAYLFLVLFAGLMSGLTMGLLSLDKTQLEILQKAGKPKERKYANKIYPIVKRHHLLLVTLLLANAMAVETMPIFMDKITNPLVAIIVSVTAVLIFGEVVPQALCTRYGLSIGYYLSPLVHFLMVLMFVLAWPISKLLDCLLGNNHAVFFRRAELKELVSMHQAVDAENEEPLSIDEIMIIQGALDLKDKTAKDAMVPLDSVFMLKSMERLDLTTMNKINDSGHSRIPICKHDKQDVIGVIIVKTIIALDPKDGVCVTDVMRPCNSLLTFHQDEPLYNILNACQTGKSHMCLVEDGQDIVGIITLEDVIEEILQEEIVDETDKYIDVAKRVQVARMMHRLSRSRMQQPILTTSNQYPALTTSNQYPSRNSLIPVNDERTPLIN